MTTAKRETLTKYLIGISWSILLVAGTALFATGGKWQAVGQNTVGVKEMQAEVTAVRDRVTKLESDLSHIAQNQQEMKAQLERMDERQRSEYMALMRAIRDGRSGDSR
jgi:formiminotetrahydrofolate cyclodeaminase